MTFGIGIYFLLPFCFRNALESPILVGFRIASVSETVPDFQNATVTSSTI